MKAMHDAGFDDSFSASITAASSTIGPVVPPSIPFVVYASVTSVSVGSLFMAGFIPGFLMAIAMGIAATLGVNSDSYLMAVAIGASCAFLTPIGHQNNTLILGPGGFRFGDYWRLGLPLEVLVVAVSIPLLLIVWPL